MDVMEVLKQDKNLYRVAQKYGFNQKYGEGITIRKIEEITKETYRRLKLRHMMNFIITIFLDHIIYHQITFLRYLIFGKVNKLINIVVEYISILIWRVLFLI